MIDIETLGLGPGATILSIGAVRFSTDGLGEEFYREISLQSCQAVGLEIDADTLEWWLEQDGDVADILTGGEQLEDDS
jgi:DNA polymerase III epsilon subunit-like protein